MSGAGSSAALSHPGEPRGDAVDSAESPVEWDSDGIPRSPRFGDIYRSASGGLEQARHVFLRGCGLPAAWAGQPQWRILETGFGLGLNFLATWRAWKDDPQRPVVLHFASIEAWPVQADDLRRSVAAYPELQPLAEQLSAQWWGLLPGFHRLSFEGGRVLLTLCVGDVKDMLREHDFRADSVFLDGFSPEHNPSMWELATLKAVTRLCRRGTTIATWTVAGSVRHDLQQCGFQLEKAQGLAPKRHCLHGRYAPSWPVKRLLEAQEPVPPARCLVIGAGLAGAAVAASFARRGWQVEVIDAAEGPASGASALPAGLMAPYQSPDDGALSRLTRSGIRMTLGEAESLLQRGIDWQDGGVLQHRVDDPRPAPALGAQGQLWTREATPHEKAGALLDAPETAWWHEKAAWVKPSTLVHAWLAQPGIRCRWRTHVLGLAQADAEWAVLGEGGQEVARAQLVVVAAANGSAALLGDAVKLNPVRGQVSWSFHAAAGQPWPLRPVNGHGHFLPAIPLEQGTAWFIGSSYIRGDVSIEARKAEHDANLERLRLLLPQVAGKLESDFAAGRIQAWNGIRCASADRRPLVGPVGPGLWTSTALGSRGLSFAILCAELLAARLHGEPMPLPRKLADALSLERQRPA